VKRHSYEFIEDMLRRYYAELQDGMEAPPLWEGIQERLKANGTTSTRSLKRIRRPVRIALKLSACAAASAALIMGSFYFAPRWQTFALAFITGQSQVNRQISGVLMDDPGLLHAFQQGAFQPLDLTATEHGITLQLLDFYADSNRTVVVYKIDGPPAPRDAIVMEPWGIATSNADELSSQALSGQPVPKPRTFSVYVRDQFGLVHQSTGGATQGQYGYLEFSAIPDAIRSLGLRLTLHVDAMATILAENGKFGKRTIQYQTGPWNISFVALPESTPALLLTPNVSTARDNVRMTLSSIRITRSQTVVMLSLSGLDSAKLFKGESRIQVQTPSGRPVSPTAWTGNERVLELQFPPLLDSGVYKMVLQGSTHTWTVSWNQPSWSESTSTWISSPDTNAIYEGTDLSRAANLVDFPLCLPPDGWKVVNVSVTPDFRPILSGSTVTTPYSVAMRLSRRDGAQFEVTESRTFLTPVPYSESLEEFITSLSQSKGNEISAFKESMMDGVETHMWNVSAKVGEGQDKNEVIVPVLYLYPKWGSIEVTPVPDQLGKEDYAKLKEAVMELARGLISSTEETGLH
jgi:hypothetical protein